MGSLPALGNRYQGGNWVRSYLVPSPNTQRYTDIVVNYTIQGQHHLHEGFVVRYGLVENGKVVGIRSYGEGEAWPQDPFPLTRAIWCSGVSDTWQDNQQEIIDAAGG